jgi:hypothetical protein
MSSHVFQRTAGGRVREITVEKQFEPRNLESFDPVTRELYRHLPATIPTKTYKKSHLSLVLFEEPKLTVTEDK